MSADRASKASGRRGIPRRATGADPHQPWTTQPAPIGLETVAEGLPHVSRETHLRLETYLAHLRLWQSRINLVGQETLPDSWNRHILDSLQLARHAPTARSWVDIGSGAGFPGLVLAIWLKDVPKARVLLVESNQKKAAFLQFIVTELTLPARVVAERFEAIRDTIQGAEIITARALASLPRLLELCEPLLNTGAKGLFPRGRNLDADRTFLREQDGLWHRWHPSITDPDAAILELWRRPAGSIDILQRGDLP